MAEPTIEFWEDINRRLEELRLKAAVLTETLLAVDEVPLAKDAHALGASVLSMRYNTTDRIATIRAREAYGKGRFYQAADAREMWVARKGDPEFPYGTVTGRMSTNEPPFEEVTKKEEKGGFVDELAKTIGKIEKPKYEKPDLSVRPTREDDDHEETEEKGS
jgi:hypothetical protein